MAFILALLLSPSTGGVESIHQRACEQLVTCGECISGATLYVNGRNETFACYYCLSPKDNSYNCQGWNKVLDLLDADLPCSIVDVNFLDCSLSFGAVFVLVLATVGALLLLFPACLAVCCCSRCLARVRRARRTEDEVPLRGRGGAAAALRDYADLSDGDGVRNDEELAH